MSTVLRRAGEGDRDAVIRLLDAAFQNDPVTRWLFPDAEHRRSANPRLMAAFLDIVLRAGRVDLLADGSGTALWLPARDGEEAEEEEDDTLSRAFAESAPGNERVLTLNRLMDEIHPDRAHEYLWLIAVNPARQGRGRGTALLAQALERCDREGTPAYLEATSPSSRALYQRHGFVPTEPALALPDGPTLWPMWREPRP
ncbi:N-acetyltransferase [Streptomyces inusitatus]|uniref:N-acetyltransferase n=1 Tax=Streptomyces inusitatus TaxID=68221 RepID=A0A918QAJ2_9ACTN|nr:GNAT family N-acetyltransferase [Streptomyces inusitatus]GGZ37838.1 N-acetyltransferase [Streptomyces inusitatus]